jgi:MFS family permease
MGNGHEAMTDHLSVPCSERTISLDPSVTDVQSTTCAPSADESEFSQKSVLTILGASLALFCTFGQMNAFGTFLTYYKSHQLDRLSSTTISWIGSLQLFVFFVSGTPVGTIYDKYGAKLPMLFGSAIHISSLLLTSFSTQYWEYILTHGLLFGLGVALVFYPCLAAVSTHFARRRSAALGVAMAGSGIGGVLYPIILQRTFDRIGFGWSVRLCAGISTLFCILACLTVSSGSIPRPSPCKGAEPEKPRQDDVERPSEVRVGMMDVFKDIVYGLLIGGNLFVSLGLFIPYFFISSYTRSLPTPPSLALSFYTLSIMNGAGVLGRLIPPLLADSLGPFNLLLPSACFMGISTLTLWFVSRTMTTVLIYAIVYGFFSGSFIALINPCVASISDVSVIGRRFGGLYTLIAFPALIGNPLGAVFLDKFSGSYHGMIVFSGTSILVGSVLLVWARWKRSRGALMVAV